MTGSASGKARGKKTRFLSAGLIHNVVSDEDNDNAKIEHICPDPNHQILPNEGRLVIDPDKISKKSKRRIDEALGIVQSNGLNPGAIRIGGNPSSTLVTQLSAQGQPERGIVLASEYHEPEIAVAPSEGRVKAPQFEEELQPGAEIVHRFKPETVAVTKERVTNNLKQVPDNFPEWARAVNTETEIENIRIQPEIKVRDFGYVEVDFQKLHQPD